MNPTPQDDPQPATPEPPEAPTAARIGVTSAGVLYGLLALAAFAGGWFITDHTPLALPDHEGVALWIKVVTGAGVGLAVFGADQLAERFIPLFQRMAVAFRALLGNIGPWQAIALAAFSSVGEELFFRGFLQSWLGIIPASIAFGLLHIAPDKRLWPWPILAVAMGFAFGGLFEYTGDVLAPTLAHFTINYFGLMALARFTSGTPSQTRD